MNIQLNVNAYQDMNERAHYFYELARQFTRGGHNVRISAWHLGGTIVPATRDEGIVLAQYRDSVPWDPDVIHAENAISTERARESYPDIPVVRTVFGLTKVDRIFGDGAEAAHIVTTQAVRSRVQRACYLVPFPLNLDEIKSKLLIEDPPRHLVWVGNYNKHSRAAVDQIVAERRDLDGIWLIGQGEGVGFCTLPVRHDWHVYLSAMTVVACPSRSYAVLVARAAGKEVWQFGLAHGQVQFRHVDPHPQTMQRHDSAAVADTILDIYHHAINRPVQITG